MSVALELSSVPNLSDFLILEKVSRIPSSLRLYFTSVPIFILCCILWVKFNFYCV
jgi:hypothetical protein